MIIISRFKSILNAEIVGPYSSISVGPQRQGFQDRQHADLVWFFREVATRFRGILLRRSWRSAWSHPGPCFQQWVCLDGGGHMGRCTTSTVTSAFQVPAGENPRVYISMRNTFPKRRFGICGSSKSSSLFFSMSLILKYR